eukprot:6190552-Pleurochrysis_carterae.AAC.7
MPFPPFHQAGAVHQVTSLNAILTVDHHNLGGVLTYNSYHIWRELLVATADVADEAAKKDVALRMAVAAVELTELFDQAASGNGKTRMLHIIIFILTRDVAS